MASYENVSDRKVLNDLTASSSTRLYLFKGLEHNRQGYILLRLPARIQRDLVRKLSDDEIINLLNPLDPDKAADVLQLMKESRSKKIIERLNESVKEKVQFLLKFNPKAAAGLMNLNYIIFTRDTKISKILEDLTDYEKKNNTFPTILIIENNKLIGELPGSTLALHTSKEIKDKYIKKIPSIRYDNEVNKVVNAFTRHPHNKIVVKDQDESILGIIHSSDILRLMDKRNTRDLYGFAGVHDEESALDSALTKVKFRYKWLILNLGTAFLAASVVGLFEGTISEFTLLAVYMPIVAGMGGNAGTQALAVAVRGLVLKEVSLSTGKRLILNEMAGGAINGLINGTVVAGIATFINQSPALGFVLAIAMIVNLVVAGFFGALVPMFMKAIGKDPASSATIFITTATDIIGFFVFLGLASIVL